MEALLQQIKSCTICSKFLPHTPNPVVVASSTAKLLIIGQAPGRIVHQTHIAWNDKSGDNLRNWMGINKTEFYNTNKVALMPMGFCYPGTGLHGDNPPRPECAQQWHGKLLQQMPNIKLTLLIGNYAQKSYLGKLAQENLTKTVEHFNDYLPQYFVLPHPSPRNNIWQAKNRWFACTVLPTLQQMVAHAMA